MDPIWAKLIEQSPGVAGVVIVAWLFIRFLKSERRIVMKAIIDMHQEHIEARRLTRDAIDRNNERLTENIRVTQHNSDQLEMLSKAVDRLASKFPRTT